MGRCRGGLVPRQIGPIPPLLPPMMMECLPECPPAPSIVATAGIQPPSPCFPLGIPDPLLLDAQLGMAQRDAHGFVTTPRSPQCPQACTRALCAHAIQRIGFSTCPITDFRFKPFERFPLSPCLPEKATEYGTCDKICGRCGIAQSASKWVSYRGAGDQHPRDAHFQV